MFLKRNLAFLSLLIFGLSYLSFYSLSFFKSVTGFFMQLMFLVEAIKYGDYSYFNLLSLPLWLNLITGPFVLYLTFLIGRGLVFTLRQQLHTRKFINSLNIISKKSYFLFKSTHPQAFTYGLIFPQIYISTSLKSLCTSSELQSILYHESMHVRSCDPLKDQIINFISLITPIFPFKTYIFGLYSALVEINCDNFAASRLKNKRPLVSALSKILQHPVNSTFSLSSFSASTFRFQTLLNTAKIKIFPFFALNSAILSLLIIFSVFTYRTDLFYQCSHLLSCVVNLFDSTKVEKLVTHTSCSTTSSTKMTETHDNSCQYHLLPPSQL